MKATGCVRKIDELGRIVLPKDLRRQLNIESSDPLEIFIDNDSIVLKKYQPGCIFCGSMDRTLTYKGHIVCAKCVDTMFEIK